jgi:hypothetical protein
MQSRTIYLKSYDRFDEFLRYELPQGRLAIIGKDEIVATGATPALGAFTRAGNSVAGVFASPEGPIVFLDSLHIVARFGRTSAQIERMGSSATLRFTLVHPQPGEAPERVTVLYAERPGLYTNPYDTEAEDVDLFALIASGLRAEKFFHAYTREW